MRPLISDVSQFPSIKSMYLSTFINVSAFSVFDNKSITIQADAVAVAVLYELIIECNKQRPSPRDFTTSHIVPELISLQ